MKPKKKKKLVNTENRLVVVGAVKWVKEKVINFQFSDNKFWACDIQYDDYSYQQCIVHLKVAKSEF